MSSEAKSFLVKNNKKGREVWSFIFYFSPIFPPKQERLESED